MSFGRDSDGAVVDVTQVPRGLACACACLGCGGPLLSRQGPKKAWHFAHVDSGEIRSCGETSLHLAAKHVLQQLSSITLPKVEYPLPSRHDSAGREVKVTAHAPSRVLAIESVLLEVAAEGPLGTVRFDATLKARQESVAVEIRVTHAVDELKKTALEAIGLPVLEIDLSAEVYRCGSFADLTALVGAAAKREFVACVPAAIPQEVQAAQAQAERKLTEAEAALTQLANVSAEERVRIELMARQAGIDLLNPPEGLGSLEWVSVIEGPPQRLFGGRHHMLWQLAFIHWLMRQRAGGRISLTSMLEGIFQTLDSKALASDEGHDAEGLLSFVETLVLPRHELSFLYNDDHGYGENWYRLKLLPGGARVTASGALQPDEKQMGLW
jgi:hypothetical protein